MPTSRNVATVLGVEEKVTGTLAHDVAVRVTHDGADLRELTDLELGRARAECDRGNRGLGGDGGDDGAGGTPSSTLAVIVNATTLQCGDHTRDELTLTMVASDDTQLTVRP
jgi:hypothetical protein